MRIVTWNCYHGECLARVAPLERLRPDLIILQECTAPKENIQRDDCVWFPGAPSKGVGVVARGPWRVASGPVSPGVPDTAFPVVVSGPERFHLLAIWSMRRPTYVKAILAALEHYADFLHAAPALVVGDFNSDPKLDRPGASGGHADLERRLREEFGLVSAFHVHAARNAIAGETATHYWRWKEDQPFHLDYCFFPESWTPRLQSVEISSYDDLAGESDHRPLLADFAL